MKDADAIVIGSGIGGLGTAALLARRGWKVLVLERHYVAGGMTHVFRRPGFEWDVGVHYLGKVHDPEDYRTRVFDHVTGGALQWAPMNSVYDRMIFDDADYEFRAGEEALERDLGRAFPKERRALGTWFSHVRKAARAADGFFLQRIIPPWLAWGLHPIIGFPFQRYARKTTRDVLRSLTSDERLMGVLTGQWGNYALPPGKSSFAMHALVSNYYLDGANYPVGGASRIAASMEPIIRAAGGEIRTSSAVQRILVRNGRAVGVELRPGARDRAHGGRGQELFAPCIISNAGVETTLRELLPAESQRPAAVDATLQRLQHLPPSLGHVALHLGLNGTAQELGLTSSNLWVHAGYDHDRTTQAHLRDAEAPFPFVFISSPSAKDPHWERRYPGKSTVVAIAPVQFGSFSPWAGTKWGRRGAEYDAYKQSLSGRLLDVVERTLPQIKGSILHCELSTPLSTEHFTGRPSGAMYGLEHSPARFDARWLRPESPLKGLFHVGQDMVTVGVGAALMSAVLATSVILKRNVLRDIMRGESS